MSLCTATAHIPVDSGSLFNGWTKNSAELMKPNALKRAVLYERRPTHTMDSLDDDESTETCDDETDADFQSYRLPRKIGRSFSLRSRSITSETDEDQPLQETDVDQAPTNTKAESIKVKRLRQNELERLVLQQMCIAICDQGITGVLERKLDVADNELDHYHKKTVVLSQELKNLDTVFRKFIEKTKKKKKEMRSVGIQVDMDADAVIAPSCSGNSLPVFDLEADEILEMPVLSPEPRIIQELWFPKRSDRLDETTKSSSPIILKVEASAEEVMELEDTSDLEIIEQIDSHLEIEVATSSAAITNSMLAECSSLPEVEENAQELPSNTTLADDNNNFNPIISMKTPSSQQSSITLSNKKINVIHISKNAPVNYIPPAVDARRIPPSTPKVANISVTLNSTPTVPISTSAGIRANNHPVASLKTLPIITPNNGIILSDDAIIDRSESALAQYKINSSQVICQQQQQKQQQNNQSLLKPSLRPPPVKKCASTVVVPNLTQLLPSLNDNEDQIQKQRKRPLNKLYNLSARPLKKKHSEDLQLGTLNQNCSSLAVNVSAAQLPILPSTATCFPTAAVISTVCPTRPLAETTMTATTAKVMSASLEPSTGSHGLRSEQLFLPSNGGTTNVTLTAPISSAIARTAASFKLDHNYSNNPSLATLVHLINNSSTTIAPVHKSASGAFVKGPVQITVMRSISNSQAPVATNSNNASFNYADQICGPKITINKTSDAKTKGSTSLVAHTWPSSTTQTIPAGRTLRFRTLRDVIPMVFCDPSKVSGTIIPTTVAGFPQEAVLPTVSKVILPPSNPVTPAGNGFRSIQLPMKDPF